VDAESRAFDVAEIGRMTRVYPNIVPESNNLRLPDALTIKHGPAPLLARFVLAADKAARRRGIFLRVRHDFEELVSINKFYAERGLWYPLLDAFNPRCADLTPENAYWISSENADGEIVGTNVCRVLDWTGTNLAEQACSLWYGRNTGQRCIVTAEAAQLISGVVAWGGAAWVRQDFRGKQLSYLTSRALKAYACARWPIDWSFCYIGIDNVTRGLAATYGHSHLSHGILYPDSAHGEQVVAYSSTSEFYDDIAGFMARGGVLQPDDFDWPIVPSGLEHIVTNTSPDGVDHGSISRS
jgi:hypothetical protein